MDNINNFADNSDFPPRHKLAVKKITETSTNYNYLVEQVAKLDLEEVVFDDTDEVAVESRKTKTKIDKQKVYFWIRVYLKEECKIEPGDDITIKYSVSGETLFTKFICYAKKGNLVDYIDGEPVVTNYNSEDDTKVLCLMVDEEKINYDSADIPFIRRLFRIGRHYEFELLRRADLILTNDRNKEELDYYDIEF